MKIGFIIAALLLSACTDVYRYPCQDPKNHNKDKCNPPPCEADGTCTKYLL